MMCKETPRDDEWQLLGMMAEIIGLTFGLGCICTKAARENQTQLPPMFGGAQREGLGRSREQPGLPGEMGTGLMQGDGNGIAPG